MINRRLLEAAFNDLSRSGYHVKPWGLRSPIGPVKIPAEVELLVQPDTRHEDLVRVGQLMRATLVRGE